MPKQEDTTENGSCFPSVILNAYQCMVTHFGYNIYVNKLTSSSLFFLGGGGEGGRPVSDHTITSEQIAHLTLFDTRSKHSHK